MAVAPIELRHYLRYFTLEDLKAGLQPIQQRAADGTVLLYAPPVLQVRWREKTDDGGLRWSEFVDVRYEREGDA